jgi:PAS domain S-box-containing protein
VRQFKERESMSGQAGKRSKDFIGLGPNAALRMDLTNNLLTRKMDEVEETAEITNRQLSQCYHALPLHILFLICSAITIGSATSNVVPRMELVIWQALAAVPVLMYAYVMWRNARKIVPFAVTHIRLLELAAFVEGIAWSIPLALFLPVVDQGNQTVIIGVSLAVAGVGTLALSRVPIGAIVLSCLMVGSASRAIFLYISDGNLIPPILCAIYGIVLVGIVMSMHWEFLRRTRAEMDSERQKQVISLLLNDFERGTSDWLWETDAEGKLTYFSPRLASLLGKQDIDIIGRTYRELAGPSSEHHGWTDFETSMAKQVDVPAQLLTFEGDGQTRHWQMTARPLYNADGRYQGFRGVGRDISEKWDAEMSVQNARESAERASAAKTQFLAIISHEIRTPINAIVGFAELLVSSQADTLSAKSKRDYLNTILDSAGHLQGLINDLLDATRIEKGTLTLIDQENDAAELVEITAKMCREQAEKAGVSIVARVTDDVYMKGDLTRLRQVFLNLLTNAIKFSPPGGIVNLDLDRAPNDDLVLSIRDSGIGIKIEDVERIFEPFVQADEGATRRFGGVGLGLSIARKVARLHGGDIVLESTPGAGTTARFTMPAHRIRWPQSATAKIEARGVAA